MEKVLLNKKECLFLKGIAIIFIILHNYCHEFPSAIEANEFLWIKGNIISFYNHLIHPSYFIISDFFSFWGHYGIVIFLFISGYGLVMKYEQTSVPHKYKTFDFIKKHYVKLFSLMIWGFIANMIVNKLCTDYFFHDIWTIPGQLLLIINLIPNAHINPGPYWYLGMTLQLYIIYIFLIFKKSDYSIYLLLGIFSILQLSCAPDNDFLYWMRRNSIGCFLPFAIGIIFARHQHIIKNVRYNFFIVAFLIAVIFVCNFNYYLWVISPLFIVLLSIIVTKACSRSKVLFHCFERIGRISSTIFIMHPIIHWVLLPNETKRPYIYLYIIVYTILSILLGIIYRNFLNHVSNTNGTSYNKQQD